MDNLNGIKIEENFIKVDHVKNYYLNNRDDFPTGPDDRGWYEKRELTTEEQTLID